MFCLSACQLAPGDVAAVRCLLWRCLAFFHIPMQAVAEPDKFSSAEEAQDTSEDEAMKDGTAPAGEEEELAEEIHEPDGSEDEAMKDRPGPAGEEDDDGFAEEELAEEIHEPAPAEHDVVAAAALVPAQQDLAVQVGKRVRAQLSVAKRLVEAGSGSNRVRDGWRAMRAEEQSVDPVIPQTRFAAFARSVLAELLEKRGLEPDAIKFGQDALHMLQVFTEATCEHFMQDSAMLAGHARRVTIHTTDLRTVVALRRRWGDPLFFKEKPATPADGASSCQNKPPKSTLSATTQRKQFWLEAVHELRQKCSALGLAQSGKKVDLVSRVQDEEKARSASSCYEPTQEVSLQARLPPATSRPRKSRSSSPAVAITKEKKILAVVMRHGAESKNMRVWRTTPLWRLRVRMARTLGVHDADDVLVMLKGQEVEEYEATVGSSGIEDGEILQVYLRQSLRRQRAGLAKEPAADVLPEGGLNANDIHLF
ncbi:unnamed protein product [Symbiodinium microadriaticum]|nr:unnamed protein product [Symbiodinium microadriaticum]